MQIQFTRADGVRNLVELAFREEVDQFRAKARHPFFRPVTVIPYYDPRRRLSAFSRDISEDGIGMLHSMELPHAPVTILLPDDSGGTIHVSAEVRWCRPCGEGWFSSGGRFIQF